MEATSLAEWVNKTLNCAILLDCPSETELAYDAQFLIAKYSFLSIWD